MKNSTIAVTLIIATLILGGILYFQFFRNVSPVKVFHAGSLSKPFQKMDEENKEFNLQREPSGSVEVMRKITELGKKPDIAAASDYSLIPDFLISENLADWYIQFARNEVVLAYTNESAYSNEIDNKNWFKILQKSDVEFAFGDPNADPGGYRAMMMIQLAEEYYNDNQIFDNLISRYTSMKAPEKNENGHYIIQAKKLEDLNPDTSKVKAGAMEVAVIPALEEGSVDYMFNYRSIAKQHDFDFVKLPDAINLSKVKHDNFYDDVKIEMTGGKVKEGKPIVYGITILKEAKNEEGAVKFLRYLLSEGGQEILENMGQPPIDPPRTNDIDEVPEDLRGQVTE